MTTDAIVRHGSLFAVPHANAMIGTVEYDVFVDDIATPFYIEDATSYDTTTDRSQFVFGIYDIRTESWITDRDGVPLRATAIEAALAWLNANMTAALEAA